MGQVLEVGHRTAGRDERQPQDDDDTEADDRGPSHLAPPSGRPEPGRERQDERKRLRLRHQRDRDQRGGRPVVAVDREHDRRKSKEQVDRFVLAPPRADIDDRWMQQDGGAADGRPAGSSPQGVDDEPGQAEVRQRGRQLHQGSDARVGGICDRLEGRLDGRQDAPDPGHHGTEAEVHVVGVRQPVDGDAVDPQDKLVQVRAEPLGRQQDDADDDAEDERDDEDGSLSTRPAHRCRRRPGGHGVRRGRRPSSVRRRRPRRPVPRSRDRGRGPPRPSPCRCRTGAPVGFRRASRP